MSASQAMSVDILGKINTTRSPLKPTTSSDRSRERCFRRHIHTCSMGVTKRVSFCPEASDDNFQGLDQNKCVEPPGRVPEIQ